MELLIKSLNMTIGNQQILKDISLKTRKGQFVGLIGSNGSGKSTLLKTVYKTLKPSGGDIYLDDLNILTSSEKKVAKKISVVSQFNELSFDMTVEQMVLLGRTPHKKMLEQDNYKDFNLLDDALKKTGLLSYKKRSYLSLSGGEKQRVILARAIVQEPKYLILDEPTNHLDIRYQLDILEIVKKLNIGILAALHDLEQAATYCDIIYALKDGQIMGFGKPEEVLTEALIETIYGVKCNIYENPITGGLGFHYYFEKEINE